MARASIASTAFAFLTLMAGIGLAAPADGPTQQGSDQWRASKLAGIGIYGPDKKRVGAISDVLLGKDGRAAFIVIGVGGFLGLGEKDVALRFDQVTFTDQPIVPPATGAAAPGSAMGSAARNGGLDPAAPVGLGTPPDPTDAAGLPAATAAGPAGSVASPMTLGAVSGAPDMTGMAPHSTAYPDHGTIDMTAEQLKSAPAFHFAK